MNTMIILYMKLCVDIILILTEISISIMNKMIK